MQIKITSWDNCPINTYYRIDECISSDRPDYEKQIELLSIVCDCSEDDIWALKMTEVSELLKDIQWINSFDFDKNIRFKKIKIGDITCTVSQDLYSFTIAQYVDFQTYFKERQHRLAEMLSVFIIPEGHQYNQGYDILEFQKLIGDNVPLTTAQSLCFFFLMQLVNSIRALQIYLDWETERMKTKMNSKTLIQKVEQAQKEMKQMLASYGLPL